MTLPILCLFAIPAIRGLLRWNRRRAGIPAFLPARPFVRTEVAAYVLEDLDRWVVDAGASRLPAWTFVPVVGDFEGEDCDWMLVDGMAVEADRPPGRLVGIVHRDGPKAVQDWIDTNADDVHALLSRRDIP
jgi:hypothetical protein